MTTRNKKLIIQVFSDLHLELFNSSSFPKIKPLAPYLFLAGDIGNINNNNFKDFLKYCNENWLKTFYVFGNHDLWSKTPNTSTLYEVKETTQNFINQNGLINLNILDNGKVVNLNEDINVIGATFWTKGLQLASNYLNDYNNIYMKNEPNTYNRLIKPEDITNISNNEYNVLTSLINYSDTLASKNLIVLTHFPPFRNGVSHPKFDSETGPIKEYFSWPNNTLDKFLTSNILAWISGHTHYSYDFVCNQNVRLISNQMGYIREAMQGVSNFNQDGLYEINYISSVCNEK